MTSYTQMTPLHYAEFVGEASVLLEAGADIDSLNSEGIPPLAQCFIREVEGGFDVLRFYMRRGADVSLLEMDRIKAEIIEEQEYFGEFHEDTGKCLGLFAAVKSAGSYRRYVNGPRAALMRLRTLCARGRATPPPGDPVLERLFAAPPPSSSTAPSGRVTRRASRLRLASRPLPNDVVWHILSFWRTTRDDGDDIESRIEDFIDFLDSDDGSSSDEDQYVPVDQWPAAFSDHYMPFNPQ